MKRVGIGFGYLLILWIFFGFSFHKFYVSVTTIDIRDNKLEIILYTFPDDLEKAIEQNYKFRIDLDNATDKTRFYINLYLKNRFEIYVNDQSVSYNFLGFTFENEKIILLMEADLDKKISKIEVVQSWLTDVYPDQQNIVHILYDGKKKSEILNKDYIRFSTDLN